MFSDLHLLRPWWLLALIPLFLCIFFYRQKKQSLGSWEQVCDPVLLPFLVETKKAQKQRLSLFLLFAASFFMIIGLTGPSWTRYPLPLFQKVMPRVVVLDLSQQIDNQDLTPSRLNRAQYLLHDLFLRDDLGQIALVVYSGAPFVASPLTEDGKTIDALLPMLHTSVMPVQGQNLSLALEEGSQIIKQAGFHAGQLLVLTGSPPDGAAARTAASLSKKGLQISIMPLIADKQYLPLFTAFAKEAGGLTLSMDDPIRSFTQWLQAGKNIRYNVSENHNFPLWRDDGLWFVFVALLFLWPIFRQNWLKRVTL